MWQLDLLYARLSYVARHDYLTSTNLPSMAGDRQSSVAEIPANLPILPMAGNTLTGHEDLRRRTLAMGSIAVVSPGIHLS